MSVVGTFTAGEDIALAIDIASGTAPAGIEVSAVLVPGSLLGGSFTPKRGASGISLGVAPRAASGGFPAGWNVTLAAAASAALAPGTYGAFATYDDDGAITIDDVPAVIRIKAALPA